MSDHFAPLACVAVFYESFDVFSYLWPAVSSSEEFRSFSRHVMSCLWGVVVFGDKSRSYLFII